MPSDLWDALDRYCSSLQKSRSGFFQKITVEELSKNGALPEQMNEESKVINNALATWEVIGTERLLELMQKARVGIAEAKGTAA